MSVVTALRPNPSLYVTTTEAHVRAAHESYSKRLLQQTAEAVALRLKDKS